VHIIGTSGHVDHGKTALIEALTGINTDRLPAEKERGMTIDLGFAHFEGPDGNPVGVIDVPGHERFIRNMVAGAWSLSCAMLVVAANEAWMQQTEDHARVLEAMGIRKVICVITKIDLVEDDILAYTTEIVRENLSRIFKKNIPIIFVSSITGEGLDKLRGFLIDLLKRLPNRKSGGSAFIHIDRVFTIKGSGTVITGSLVGGKLTEGDELTILPQGTKTRIRGIQSYYSSVTTAHPVSRVACNLHRIKKEEISRGCIAATNPQDFWSENEFIIQWEQLDEDQNLIKNHMEIEVASGTGHHIGSLHFLRTAGFARIVLNELSSVSWLAPCLFIRQGGHQILGKGHFIWPGKTNSHFRTRISSVLASYPVPEVIRDEPVLRFVLNEWLAFTSEIDKHAVNEFITDQKIEARFIGDSVVLEDRFRRELDNLITLSSRPGGVSKAEYLHSLGLPTAVMDMLVDEGLNTHKFMQKDHLFISSEQLEGEASLSPLGKRLIDMLNAAEHGGLQLKDISEPGAKKELRNLVRTGKVVGLEDEIYYSTEMFDSLAKRILDGLLPDSSFSIPEAKKKTGLSRKYIIPFLNKMEEKGMVKRKEDRRVVC